MTEHIFLSKQELEQLTGRKQRGKQIEALRRMGLPFFINAAGLPVVTRAAVEGRPEPQQQRARWQPAPQ